MIPLKYLARYLTAVHRHTHTTPALQITKLSVSWGSCTQMSKQLSGQRHDTYTNKYTNTPLPGVLSVINLVSGYKFWGLKACFAACFSYIIPTDFVVILKITIADLSYLHNNKSKLLAFLFSGKRITLDTISTWPSYSQAGSQPGRLKGFTGKTICQISSSNTGHKLQRTWTAFYK